MPIGVGVGQIGTAGAEQLDQITGASVRGPWSGQALVPMVDEVDGELGGRRVPRANRVGSLGRPLELRVLVLDLGQVERCRVGGVSRREEQLDVTVAEIVRRERLQPLADENHSDHVWGEPFDVLDTADQGWTWAHAASGVRVTCGGLDTLRRQPGVVCRSTVLAADSLRGGLSRALGRLGGVVRGIGYLRLDLWALVPHDVLGLGDLLLDVRVIPRLAHARLDLLVALPPRTGTEHVPRGGTPEQQQLALHGPLLQQFVTTPDQSNLSRPRPGYRNPGDGGSTSQNTLANRPSARTGPPTGMR